MGVQHTMTFIHKNVNSALLMLITFISVALVTATVYSVQAFDSINDAYAEKAVQADELQKQLAENKAIADTMQQAAQLNQQREQALADILQKKQQEQAAPEQEATKTAGNDLPSKASFKPATNANAGGPTFNSGTLQQRPVRKQFWGFMPRKVYIV